jgi:hypothetical protein
MVPDSDDLMEPFPVFLVSATLTERLDTAGLTGFVLEGRDCPAQRRVPRELGRCSAQRVPLDAAPIG